jgi:Metal-dependent hydrolase
VRLRVASYNIRKCVGLDWRRRPDRVLAVLAEIGADVVALQEADRRFGAKLSALPPETLAEAGWHAAPVAPHPGGLGWRGNLDPVPARAREAVGYARAAVGRRLRPAVPPIESNAN